MPKKFALDTDIGTDVDDILAIAMVLGSPEVEMSAITTVYGDVTLRARMAARTLRIADAPRIPVVPGLRSPRSGRPVWWPGHEGQQMNGLEFEEINLDQDAVDVLSQTAIVAAIAPLTNIAAAVENPSSHIEQIFLMGGRFAGEGAEHNILCDVDAADTVFRSGVPLVIAGLEQTERVMIQSAELEEIASSGSLGDLLAAEIQGFWKFTGNNFNVPHDPIAILAMVAPHLFELAQGFVSVQTRGNEAGVTSFVRDDKGPHQIIVDFDHELVRQEICTRILIATSIAAQQLKEEKSK